MKSSEWDIHGWKKHVNPSGEVIRVKTYHRISFMWDNVPARTLVADRKKLAELLQVPLDDLLADLDITIKIKRYPRHRRFNKYNKLNTYYKNQRKEKDNVKKII